MIRTNPIKAEFLPAVRRCLIPACLIIVAISAAPYAYAAGGAHVVDDSEVETPGSCHLETSITRVHNNSGYAVASPACTLASLANLEIGASAAYYRGDGSDAALLGPTLKWNLRPLSTGLGIAIDVNATWSSAAKRIETAAFIVPVSVALGKGVTINANVGGVWTRTDAGIGGFLGTQIVWQERTKLGFMVEAFDRTDGDPGAQTGARWNPDENTDVDVLVSHDFNRTSGDNLTLGLTRRF